MARLERDHKDAVYRAYLTDALAAVVENTARFAGGKTMAKRYAEIAEPSARNIDKRTGEEIAADVIKRAGLTII